MASEEQELLASPSKAAEGSVGSYRMGTLLHVSPPSQWGAPPRKVAFRTQSAPLPFGTVGLVAGRGSGHRKGNQLPDYQMIASACFRAGRRHEEAVALYSCGVLLEGAGKLYRALACYSRMLAAAQAGGDATGQLIAHNSVGVLEHRLERYESAVLHHQEHLALADSNGQFSANVNLGLSLSALGEYEKAQVRPIRPEWGRVEWVKECVSGRREREAWTMEGHA